MSNALDKERLLQWVDNEREIARENVKFYKDGSGYFWNGGYAAMCREIREVIKSNKFDLEEK
jgi:hypothetical protein